MVTLALIAIAVSLDSLVAGTAFGSRNITLRGSSLLILSLVSTLTVLVGGFVGLQAAAWLSPTVANHIGAGLLALLGAVLIFHARRESPGSNDSVGEAGSRARNGTEEEADVLIRAHIAPGLVLMVLREPVLADRDQSGSIEIGEAILLGFALAMDGAGAGMAAALAGVGLAGLAALVGAMNGALFFTGYQVGLGVEGFLHDGWWRFAPGITLLVVGAMRLFVG